MNTFFIVGAQKSGTTWLQRLLNDVPGVACFGESHFVDRLLLPVAGTVRQYNGMMKLVAERVYEGNGHYAAIQDPELLAVMRAWLLAMFQRTAGDRWADLRAVGDKTPAHSFHMPILQGLFPATRFLHMLRDGRDVVVSAYHHRARILRRLGQEQQLQPLVAEAPGLFLKWKQFTQAVLSHEQQGCPVHTVRYEALRADPQEQLQAALAFLLPEQPWPAAALAEAIARNSFSSRSGGRSAGQVNEQAFLRQGLSGGWRRELTEADVRQWDPEGLTLLHQLGYNLS